MDGAGSGDYRTIASAYANAKAGETIVVRPGTYISSFTINKDVQIIGDGGRSNVIVESPMGTVFRITEGRPRLAGITIRFTGPLRNLVDHAIDVSGGTPVIEDCNLTSSDGSAVWIGGATANPTFRNCTIWGSHPSGLAAGVSVNEQGRGTFIGNTLIGTGPAWRVMSDAGKVVRTGNTPNN